MPLELPLEIDSEVQKFNPSALIDLYVVDATSIGGPILRFHDGVSTISTDIVWDSNTYAAMPIEVSGFEVSTTGSPARPKIKVANVSGLLGIGIKSLNDLIGSKFIRKRTFAKYLDAVNFSGGVNPTADVNACFPDEMYFIDRKVSENRMLLEFELVSALDLQGYLLPGRQVLTNICFWRYRSSECSYSGGPIANEFDALCISNGGTVEDSKDKCGKKLSSCELRFGSAIIPFGAFPGVGLIK